MLIGIGYGNYIDSEKIAAVVGADSAPVKRMLKHAKASGSLIDATAGRKTRSVIVLANNQIVASSNLSDTIAEKTNKLIESVLETQE